jgi:hypothetical protein
MPKNKQQHAKDRRKSDERKEKFYIRVADNNFVNGKLSQTELKKLPDDRQGEYILQELRRKFGNNISYSCEHCAMSVIYGLGGEITDEEITSVYYGDKL